MKKILFILLALVLALSVGIIGCTTPAQQEEEEEEPLDRPIKVGIIDCYSEGPSVHCFDALNGFKLALDDINEEGVLGQIIEYTTRDTKFKSDIALSMAKELVMNEEVDFLVGTISSSCALAVSDYAKTEKVPFLVWISKSERITGELGHRYVFSTGENSYMAGKAGAVALVEKPYTKYWIAGDDYEYGHAIADAAWRNLEELKPEVELIGQSWWAPGEPDLIPYITAMLANDPKPDAVIFAAGGASMTNVMKAIQTTGLTEEMGCWAHTATDHAVLKPLGAEAPAGVLGTMDYLFYYPDTSGNRAFVEAFQDAYGDPPGFAAFHGYNTAHFIAEAVRKAGAMDTEKCIDALEGLTIDGPTGEVEMRACDHQVILPIFAGVTAEVPEYDFVIATDITTLPGDDVMPTCDEIEAARGGS